MKRVRHEYLYSRIDRCHLDDQSVLVYCVFGIFCAYPLRGLSVVRVGFLIL